MPVVEQYWNGVLRRLQAEVDGFNRLIAHRGEQGRENELALARILQPLVPTRYAVGTGLLIDSHDNVSKQCDVVLFDQADQPRMLAQTTQLLHPVETVRAVIEVKTTLDAGEVRDAGAKKASVDALRPAAGFSHRDGSMHPLFLLFAYDADSSPATVAANLRGLPASERPDLMCLISPGIVAGDPRLLSDPSCGGDDGYVVGAALLLDGGGLPVDVDGPGPYADHDGRAYPVVGQGDAAFLGHPARALLLFTDGLLRGLSALDGRETPVTSPYVTASTRQLAPIPPRAG
jgi:hypothetical protein